jgi:hypothetical protein
MTRTADNTSKSNSMAAPAKGEWTKVEAGVYQLAGTDILIQEGAGYWWLGHVDPTDRNLIDLERPNQPYTRKQDAIYSWLHQGLFAVGHTAGEAEAMTTFWRAGAPLGQAIAMALDMKALCDKGHLDDQTGKWANPTTPKEGKMTAKTNAQTLQQGQTLETPTSAALALGKRTPSECVAQDIGGTVVAFHTTLRPDHQPGEAILMVKRDGRPEQWAYSTHHYTPSKGCFWGHYDMAYEKAAEDFEARCKCGS